MAAQGSCSICDKAGEEEKPALLTFSSKKRAGYHPQNAFEAFRNLGARILGRLTLRLSPGRQKTQVFPPMGLAALPVPDVVSQSELEFFHD